MLAGCRRSTITDNPPYTHSNSVSMLGRRCRQWSSNGPVHAQSSRLNQCRINVDPPLVTLSHHLLRRYNPDPAPCHNARRRRRHVGLEGITCLCVPQKHEVFNLMIELMLKHKITGRYIVASELKDPICHSDECKIGSFSSEATIYRLFPDSKCFADTVVFRYVAFSGLSGCWVVV